MKKYSKPMAFVEKINISDVVALNCSTLLSDTVVNSTSNTCTYTFDVELGTYFSSSNAGCTIVYGSNGFNDTECYYTFLAGTSLFDS